MTKRKSLIAILLLVIIVITSSCGESNNNTNDVVEDNKNKKIVYLNNFDDPSSLHPVHAKGFNDAWLVEHMFKGLYTKTPSDGPMLSSAKKVSVSDDGLVWTFTIDTDKKWSTGNPVTAHDFYESFIYTLTPDNAVTYAYSLYVFKNGEAFAKGEVPINEVGVKAIDDETLELTLEAPVAYLPDLLTNTFFFPIDSKNAKQYPNWYESKEHYSANGPFTLKEWTAKDKVVVEKNENYYNAHNVKLDEIHWSIVTDKTTEWQMFEQGELDLVYDILPDVLEQLQFDNDERLEISPSFESYYYLFNTEIVPFNNPKVRKALSMSIDRQSLIDNVVRGGQTPAYTLTPIGVDGAHGVDFVETVGELYSEDLVLASTLLREGLEEEGLDISTWSFTLLYNADELNKKIAEAIQNMWVINLGINVELESVEYNTLLTRRKEGDYEVARSRWAGDYMDPLTFLELFASYSDYNEPNYKSDEYNKLLDDAKYTIDTNKRLEILKEAETTLINDMPIMPIYYYTKSIVTNPKLEGVYTPVNYYPILEFADIK